MNSRVSFKLFFDCYIILNIWNRINNIEHIDFYSKMGLWNNYWVSLSLRDSKHPEKYIGSNEDRELSQRILKEICEELNLDYKECEGEAALYGSKIDFMFKDA